jgi:Uma2 family endonuclease
MGSTTPPIRKLLPPLENGDQMDVDEFRRRSATLPEDVKAELIEGTVYIRPYGPAADYLNESLDPTVPPLEPGDQMDFDEFVRRWAAYPNLKRAELLDGEVFMPAAAVTADFHARPHAHLIAWLGTYAGNTPGVDVLTDPTIRLGRRNGPQPDGCLAVLPSHGGRVSTSPDGFYVGAPELVVEISGSTVGRDLTRKLAIYREHEVREYLVYRSYDGELDAFVLKGLDFERRAVDQDGIYRSVAFPGAWLNVGSLVAGDLAGILSTTQAGIGSAEHAEFVRKLASQCT